MAWERAGRRGRRRTGFPVATLFGWLRDGRGVAGLLGSGLIWFLSAGALAMAMRANLTAHEYGQPELLVRHLRGAAVVWTLGFTLMQVGALLGFAFVLRACYRIRAAVCFAVGAGFVIAADVLGLFALLVWIGTRLGAS